MDASSEATLPKLLIFLLIVSGYSVICDEECTPGVKSMGYTVPKGDITVEYGKPLDIYCMLNEEEAKKRGPNASQYLMFRINSREISREMVQVINSTAIKLHIDKPEKTNQETYMCVFKKNKESISVCMNFVYVGVPPQPVNDFKCISHNLDNLTCTWTAPENYVTTNYSLYSFRMNTRYNCPKIEENVALSEMSCTWSLTTDPIYRQSVPDYFFYLNMSNVFGTYTMPKIHIKHFKHVRPNAPENLRVLGKTWNSISLAWKVPTTMVMFSEGLYHRILYQSVYGNKKWLSRPIFFRKDVSEVQYDLDNLEYAHTYYDIRVSLRSAVADPDDESMWSDNASLTEITESKKPDAPPKTNIGSFEVLAYGNNSDRNVRIYWSHIPEERRSGENFSYVVYVDGEFDTESTSTENAYMLIERLSIHKSYTFYVRARNEKGLSDEKSAIHVPAHQNCPRGPSRLTKEELGGGHYRLTWQPPKLEDNQIIKNYTIFWCNDDRELPPCTGKLDWLIIPGNLTSYNQTIPSNRTYQFAISANTEHGSSGMVWTHCTDLYYKDSVGKINVVWLEHLESHSTEVNWNFGCSDKRVTGFLVQYCPIKSPEKNKVCREEIKNVTVSNDKNSAKLFNLYPYTTYSVQVAAIINHTTYSQKTEILLTTLEAAPSTPPTHLRIANVTNSTITITWKPPAVTNGGIHMYKIFYNDKESIVDPNTSVTLTNLNSFKNYNITVQACTVHCSERSEALSVWTEIGYPSTIRRPLITQNATYTLISWDTPDEPNGRNERYELKIKEKRDYENITTIFNTTAREWGIQSCGRENKYNSFFVSVRAVNFDKDRVYYGQWSDEVESYCRSPSNYVIYILVPIIILFLLGMTYLFRKIYGHFQEMRDVGVKLPQGLQNEVVETDINLTNWTVQGGNDDGDHHAADDERHVLINNKTESAPNKNGGDSSGCSSAHESATCSIDSASNISSSTSDSGTEQPRTPSAEDLTELGVNSLRQRNNVRPVNKPYVPLPIEVNNPNAAKLGCKTYCVLGVDPKVNTDTNSTYIPAASLGEKAAYNAAESPNSPPYVLTGELVKTANPSYVPYKADVTAKKPAYVIAGNKDLISPDVLDVEKKQYVPAQDSSAYIKVAENGDIGWQPTSVNTNSKTGYISIGDVPSLKKEPKGYVPHRQFESKALKED